jgi:hypothetical protein
MLVAFVDIPCPSFIGDFDFLSAHLCDEPLTRSLRPRFTRSMAVRSGRQFGPRIDGRLILPLVSGR